MVGLTSTGAVSSRRVERLRIPRWVWGLVLGDPGCGGDGGPEINLGVEGREGISDSGALEVSLRCLVLSGDGLRWDSLPTVALERTERVVLLLERVFDEWDEC